MVNGLTKEVIDALPPNLLVPHYLSASFCYYQWDMSPMTDHVFDHLCQRLLESYDEVTHRHRHLVDKDSLRAGTCLLALDDYPGVVKYGANQYYISCMNNTLGEELLKIYGPRPQVRRRPRPVPAPTVKVIRRRPR